MRAASFLARIRHRCGSRIRRTWKSPQGLVAVMAAEQLGAEDGSAGRRFHFKMPQPIPSYLFALGVGNLVFRALGPRTGIYAEPELIEAAAWEFAENETKIIEAEKLLGPYLMGTL